MVFDLVMASADTLTLRRLLWGTVLAPLVAPAGIVILGALAAAQNEIQGIVAVILVSSAISYTCTILIAPPTVFLLRKLNCLNPAALSGCGALCGLVIMAVISFSSHSTPPLVPVLEGALLGFLVARTFAYITGI